MFYTRGNPKLIEKGKSTANAVLRFLYAHGFSTRDILQDVAKLNKSGISKVLKKLEALGLIICLKPENVLYGKIQIYGISIHGIHTISEDGEVPSDYRRFEPSKFKIANFQHYLDIQRLNLWAVKLGYTFIAAKDFYDHIDFEGDKRADAILEIKGERIAIEIERNPKTRLRYSEILANYFRELKRGTFKKVWYVMPDEKLKSSIERVMRSITTLKVKGELTDKLVTLTEAHWAYFEFKVHPFIA